ncbi:AraC family transcriptional regulator [Lachnospiraceae bacterium JLR.KK008]
MQDLIFSVFPSENFVDLGLYQFGWEQCKPAHLYGPAARNHYLFHYVISGTGTLTAQDAKGISQVYQIRSGQGFMLFPDQISTYVASENLPWEYVWLEFDGLRAREAVERAGLSVNEPVYHAKFSDIKEEMASEMMYIVNHKDSSPFHLIGHLYLFLDYLSRSSAQLFAPRNKLCDFYIKEAITFIEQNFQNSITVEDIAAACGLNRSYFGKIFHKHVGRSPQEFLIAYRMTKAAELLRLTTLSIADIGNAVGYPNQLHFSRAFKSVYQLSPRQWRMENGIRNESLSFFE